MSSITFKSRESLLEYGVLTLIEHLIDSYGNNYISVLIDCHDILDTYLITKVTKSEFENYKNKSIDLRSLIMVGKEWYLGEVSPGSLHIGIVKKFIKFEMIPRDMLPDPGFYNDNE